MKKLLIVFTILLMVIMAGCDKIDLDDSPRITVSTPGDGIVNHGSEYNLTWESDSKKMMKIELFQHGEFVETIEEAMENTREYTWTGITAVTGYGYTIKITTEHPENKNIIEGESGEFRIDSNPWVDLGSVGDFENHTGVEIAMGSDNRPVVVYNHIAYSEEPEEDKIRLHAKKWNGSYWEDLSYITQYQSNYYSLALTGDNSPYVVYTEGFIKGTHAKDFDPGTGQWISTYGTLFDAIPENMAYQHFTYALGLSTVMGSDNSPVVSFIFIEVTPVNLLDISSYEIAVNLRAMKWSDGSWKHIVEDNVNILNFNESLVLEAIDDYLTGKPLDLPYYTSMALDPGGIPYIAVTDVDSEPQMISVYTLEGNAWVSLPENTPDGYVSDGSSDFPAIAVGQDNLPVVVYRNLEDDIIMVRKWNGSTWIDLAYPNPFPGTGIGPGNTASIAIIGENYPVIASEYGISMYDGSSWVNLGYPNAPSMATGFHSWWIAATETTIAVAFPDPGDNNRVRVKILEL